MLEKNLSKIDDLKWMRIFTPVHIPTYLVEQVRDRDYTVEDFYKYQEKSCVMMKESGPSLNPLNHLYILTNSDCLTKGFLWFTIDPLSKDIFIHTYSVDKEYWGKGRAVEKLATHVKDIRRKAHLNKVYWTTNYPKHSERHGFKRSRSILMEYTEEIIDGKDADGGNRTRGECKPADPGTTTIPEHDRLTGDGGGSTECIPAVLAASIA